VLGGSNQIFESERHKVTVPGIGVQFAVSGFGFTIDYAFANYPNLDAMNLVGVGIGF
jgi:hypothetical protein